MAEPANEQLVTGQLPVAVDPDSAFLVWPLGDDQAQCVSGGSAGQQGLTGTAARFDIFTSAHGLARAAITHHLCGGWNMTLRENRTSFGQILQPFGG